MAEYSRACFAKKRQNARHDVVLCTKQTQHGNEERTENPESMTSWYASKTPASGFEFFVGRIFDL